MKKLILTAGMLVSAAASWAAIIIDVSGTHQSTTIGGNTIRITCTPGSHCARIIIYTQAVRPNVGDFTRVQETAGSPQSIRHQWSGAYLNHSTLSSDAESSATVDFLSEPKQEF